ncbi:hypothetical protein C8F01DRAFT_1082632 [Mycena amicta]|nr:hypothetical protein C8F01DRAFT_1082632 [Mycena amicta]
MKAFFATASVFFALVAHASAHAIPNPALGVKGTPARSDVQRPSTNSPCGNVNIANTIDSSTATPVAADGTVTIQVQNFNAGGDGSTSVSVSVNADGTGKNFAAGTVKTNGNAKPTKVESDKVVFTLPANTKCTGGKAKNLCVVSVKTTAGFGACTVVSQGQQAQAAPPPPATATTTTKAAAAVATTSTAGKSNQSATNNAGKGKNQSGKGKKKHHKGKKGGKKNADKAKAAAQKAAAAKTTNNNNNKQAATGNKAAVVANAKMMKDRRDIEDPVSLLAREIAAYLEEARAFAEEEEY